MQEVVQGYEGIYIKVQMFPVVIDLRDSWILKPKGTNSLDSHR